VVGGWEGFSTDDCGSAIRTRFAARSADKWDLSRAGRELRDQSLRMAVWYASLTSDTVAGHTAAPCAASSPPWHPVGRGGAALDIVAGRRHLIADGA